MPSHTRALLITLAWAMLVAPLAAGVPQSTTTVHRIGVLSSRRPLVARPYVEVFQEQLRALGYVDGQHLTFEERYAEGVAERLAGLAAELVRLPVDVIVAAGAQAIRAAQQDTRTIPIVMAGTAEPVAAGFVASLASPGGNITGSSDLSVELSGKRLEILKEAVPQSARIAVLVDPTASYHAAKMRSLTVATQALGLTIPPPLLYQATEVLR